MYISRYSCFYSLCHVAVRLKAEQRETSWVIFNPDLLFFGDNNFFAPFQDLSVILTWQYLPTPLFHSQFHLFPNTISHPAGFN